MCPNHGIFLQQAGKHMQGAGCAKCAAEKHGEHSKITLEDFVKKANKTHNFLYYYSNVKYEGSSNQIEVICKIHGSFMQIASNHVRGANCPKCTNSISKIEIKWLDGLNIPEEWRQKTIKINGKNFRPDAFDEINKICYEFKGDFFHGNPAVYNPDDYNTMVHKTYGELYRKTLEKEQFLKDAGYTVISIWESDFRKQLKELKIQNESS